MILSTYEYYYDYATDRYGYSTDLISELAGVAVVQGQIHVVMIQDHVHDAHDHSLGAGQKQDPSRAIAASVAMTSARMITGLGHGLGGLSL